MPTDDTLRHRSLLAVRHAEATQPQRTARQGSRHPGVADEEHSQRHSGTAARGGAKRREHPRRHHLSATDRTGGVVQYRTGRTQDTPDKHPDAQDGRCARSLADGRCVPHSVVQSPRRVVWRRWLSVGSDGNGVRQRTATGRPEEGCGCLL